MGSKVAEITMRRFGVTLVLAAAIWPGPELRAQDAKPEFGVVSIKRNTSSSNFMESQTLPDGTVRITNGQLSVGAASPVPVLPGNVVGLPDWVRTERYDITAKPDPASSPEQRRLMWQTLYATRMKLVAHVEERETNTFALVLARKDGKWGPGLKKSTLNCGVPPAPGVPPPAPAQSPSEVLGRCGMMGNGTSIVTGGMTMDGLARNISGRVGGPVENRTGLEGYYTFTLTFAPDNRGASPATPSDAPDFFTALDEQLGLKLETSKGKVPYFVIDHIERPTED
jgi:uncharacterized protein (TIGR03435 family)